jgi:hypothetical protein
MPSEKSCHGGPERSPSDGSIANEIELSAPTQSWALLDHLKRRRDRVGGCAMREPMLIFYTASKIVLYYQRVAVARDERCTTDAEIWDQ